MLNKKILIFLLVFLVGGMVLAAVLLPDDTVCRAVYEKCNPKNEMVMTPPGDTAGPVKKRVVIVIFDKLSPEDLLACRGPQLASLLEGSAVSLMNVNTAGSPGTEGGYLTLGAGARLRGNAAVRLAFNREENYQGRAARGLYYCHTGTDAVPAGEVIHPYLYNLIKLNEELTYPAQVGALGNTLKLHGHAAAVLGNADTDRPGRQAVGVAMDSQGMVAHGDVSDALLDDSGYFPFGLSSSHQAYLQGLAHTWENSSLIVIDWGDSSRVEGYREHLSERRREQLLVTSFQEFDCFLGGLLSYLDENTRLLLLSPSPPQAASAAGQRLTPLVLYDPSHEQGGLLRSATTRRPGIVTNIDIAPWVLDYLGLETPLFFYGSPLEVVPSGEHLAKLSALSVQTMRIYGQRPVIIKGYILSLIIIALLAGLAITARIKLLYGLRYLLCFQLNFPTALLLAPVIPAFPGAGACPSLCFIVLAASPVIVPALLLMRRNLAASFAFSGLLLCALLLVDLYRGAPLIRCSLLGYDPIGGARFYGLGNEYMGALIGSFVLGALSALSLLRRYATRFYTGLFIPGTVLFALVSLLIIYAMASPRYGANFGGAVAGGAALSVTLGGLLLLLEGKKIIFKLPHRFRGDPVRPGWLVPALFVAVTVLFICILNRPGGDNPVSHLGQTWELVRCHGPGELVKIALRKAGMNLKLIRYSLWSRVLMGFIALLAILYHYPAGLMLSIFRREPFFKTIFGGIITGSAVAFCVNDSGVVAAATVMLYGGLPLFLLMLGEVFSTRQINN